MIGKVVWRKAGREPLRETDVRLGVAKFGRTAIGKIFPDHWSFMLGEIALYSFIILVATGIFLMFFFEPSSALTVYHGRYRPLDGEQVSAAYASTVHLSWDVRCGLLFRQMHHWAANIFIAAICLHLCRIFFTAMFRKPRELNWTVGVTLLLLAILNSFMGYSLPDDLLSGTGLHIFYSVFEAVPFIGSWLAILIFGGAFPGDHIIFRLYAMHVFLIPALLTALITVHMVILIRQKHSHFPGKGKRDANVVGSRMWPTYALRSMGLLFFVVGVCFLLGGFAQINPIWVWGDFESYTILSPSVSDWYIAWIEGGLRLFPPLEPNLFGMTVPNQFWAGVLLPGATFVLLYLWPFIDRRITKDRGTHHIAARPRDCPIRTAIGAWAITFYSILLFACGTDEWIGQTGSSIGTMRAVLRGCVCVLPFVVAAITWYVARALKRSDRPSLLQLNRVDLRLTTPVERREQREREAAEHGVDLAEEPVPAAPDADQPTPAAATPAQQRDLAETPFWLRRSGK